MIVTPKVRSAQQHPQTVIPASAVDTSITVSKSGDADIKCDKTCDESGDFKDTFDRLEVESGRSSDLNPNLIRTRHLSGNKFVEDLRKAAAEYDSLATSRRSSVSSFVDGNEVTGDIPSDDVSLQPRSILDKTVTFMKCMWSGEKSKRGDTRVAVKQSNEKQYTKEYLEGTFDCSLRVQSLDSVMDCSDEKNNTLAKCVQLEDVHRNNLLLRQSGNVFITWNTFINNYVMDAQGPVPCTFLGTVTKLLSPAEKEDLANKKSLMEKERLSKIARQLTSTQTTGGEFLNPDVEDRTTFVVRVVVLGSDRTIVKIPGSGTEQVGSLCRASDGHVMISDDLRCQLNLEVTAKVRVAAIKQDDHVPMRITCRPLFSPVSLSSLCNVHHLKYSVVGF